MADYYLVLGDHTIQSLALAICGLGLEILLSQTTVYCAHGRILDAVYMVKQYWVWIDDVERVLLQA